MVLLRDWTNPIVDFGGRVSSTWDSGSERHIIIGVSTISTVPKYKYHALRYWTLGSSSVVANVGKS